MILAGLMGSVSSASGGTPTATWGGITYVPLLEGQEQTITVNLTNWDNTDIYWYLVGSNGIAISGSQVLPNAGVVYAPGTGNFTRSFNFTFNGDATTDGQATYYVRVENASGTLLIPQQGPFTVLDSSQAPTLVLDLDTASDVINNVWVDSSGQNHNAGIYFLGSYSTDNGGVYEWNGTSTQAEVTSLNTSTYGSITLSAWIKPTAVNTGLQTIIAKELCYKLRINGDSTITMSTAKGYAPWEVVATAAAGSITAGQWSQVVATVDSFYTRIYVNGVKVVETSGNLIGANGNPFDIGMVQTTGSPSDFFGGRMGEVKVWNFALAESVVVYEYNNTASRYGLSLIPLSLNFPGTGNPYLLVSNTQSDWALGSTYTIECWSKGGGASSGVFRTIASQGDGNGIDAGYANTHLFFRNSEKLYAEPTPGIWTHVAFVAEGDGYVKLYYNGQYQTNFASGSLIDGNSDLNIGRRAGINGQGFYGKLAMIRISSTAKYTTRFTPTITYGLESDTKLMLGIDPLYDKTTTHPVSREGGLGVSNDFPKLPFLGGTGSAASSANGFTVTPSIAGRADASTAYAGDTITWTITSNAGWGGWTLYYWVDNNAIPANTFVENSINGGPISLDSNGSATFTRTVAQNMGLQFRMLIGHDLYQGGDYPFHGFIGV